MMSKSNTYKELINKLNTVIGHSKWMENNSIIFINDGASDRIFDEESFAAMISTCQTQGKYDIALSVAPRVCLHFFLCSLLTFTR